MFLNQSPSQFDRGFSHRIDVRDRVRRLQKEPREESRLEVERLRQALTTDLIRLQSLQSSLSPTDLPDTDDVNDPHAELFDNLDDEGGEADHNQLLDASDPDPTAIAPEFRPLHLPFSQGTTINHPFRQAELTLRIKQATRYLSAVREKVAEKSFQYSHVMRSAPTKGIRTRARSTILKATDRISQYSRVYNRARAAMVRLGADDRTLSKFKLLSRDDVKASTAILDPNTSGSTTLRLSWIWETGTRISGSAPDTMRECKL
jgi:hypothetical protein